MSEEIKLKVNIPLFEDKELEIFDNNLHSIIEEYSKLHLEKKDQILTQRIIMKQEEEINKLTAESTEWESKCYKYKEVLDKIKEKTKNKKENCKSEIITITTGDKMYEKYIIEYLDDIIELLEEIE